MYLKNLFLKIFLFLLIFLLFFHFSFCNVYADDLDFDIEPIDINSISTKETSNTITADFPSLNSRSCVVLDRISKKILFGKNENTKVKMASTTKIMTAIIVIENYDLTLEATISKKASNTGGSRLGLKSGDKITIHDLLYGLLLCSGNDAAVALAENVAGSVENFSILMNQKASELNLNNTHFSSPHGLDSDDHYTTAYELSLLSDYALKNPTFLKIVGTKNYTITINNYPKTLSNTNELLNNLEGVYGIKTGFTNGANRCLVTACKRGDMDIICVVLGADTKKLRTQDSIKLIEYSFKNFEYINIEELATEKLETWKLSHLSNFSVSKSKTNDISFSLGNLDTPIIPLQKEFLNDVNSFIYIDNTLKAPLYSNQTVGFIKFTSNGTELSNINIIINNAIPRKSIVDYLCLFFKNSAKTYNTFIKNF